MRIIIIGNGKVGYTLAKQLSGENHDLVLIDKNAEALANAEGVLDILCVEGSGASIRVLREAGVRGADLVDGTPILDIKPYIRYGDCHPEASGGFTDRKEKPILQVELPEPWRSAVPPDRLAALIGVLAQDPRPSYHRDPQRLYGLSFAGLEVRFTVEGDRLTVREVLPEQVQQTGEETKSEREPI